MSARPKRKTFIGDIDYAELDYIKVAFRTEGAGTLVADFTVMDRCFDKPHTETLRTGYTSPSVAKIELLKPSHCTAAEGDGMSRSAYLTSVTKDALGCGTCKYCVVIERHGSWFRSGCTHPDIVFKSRPVPIVDARGTAGRCRGAALLHSSKTK